MADYTGATLPAFTTTPATADWNGEYDGVNLSPGVTTVQYAQRVYSSGLSQWCYYVGAINQAPASSATTPNWTGAITRYENLGPV